MGIGGGLISTPVRYTNGTIWDIHDLCEYQGEKLMFVPKPQFFLSSQTSLSSLKIRGKSNSISYFNNMDQIKHWQKCPGLFCKKGQMRDCKCGWDWVPSIVFFCLYDITYTKLSLASVRLIGMKSRVCGLQNRAEITSQDTANAATNISRQEIWFLTTDPMLLWEWIWRNVSESKESPLKKVGQIGED